MYPAPFCRYDARGNEVTPANEWMGRGRPSGSGMLSVPGHRASDSCEEAMCSTQGECTAHEGAQNDIEQLKRAALAAATSALGITELPEPASFRAPSFLPMLGNEAPAASTNKAEVPISLTGVAGSSLTGTESCSDAASYCKLQRPQATLSCKKRQAGPIKQASGTSQLTQSQIDANWDAL
jgi:hypothetical protein